MPAEPAPQDAFAFGGGRPTDRLFFALFPDAAAAARIAGFGDRLRRERGLRGRVLAEERLHVTLHHLGDYAGVPADVVAAARAAAAAVDAAPFGIVFDRVESFAGRARRRPLVLRGGDGVAGIEQLQSRLGDAMRRHGLARHVDARFVPHLTLLYDDCTVDAQAIEPIGWSARGFALVHSLLGRSTYRVLDRWPLPSPAPSQG